MENKYYIIDSTSNLTSIAFVLNESGDIVHTSENCICFDVKEEAQEVIDRNNWKWAAIISL